MNEILFLIEEDIDGSYTARARKESIFTQASDIDTLKELWDAVRCHFPNTQTRPVVIHEYRVRDRDDYAPWRSAYKNELVPPPIRLSDINLLTINWNHETTLIC